MNAPTEFQPLSGRDPADARPKDVPRWNFHKYLIGRDGYIADVFPESVAPSDTRVRTAIARALADS